MAINLGLIANRHPLPVSEYLMEADATEQYGYHQRLYDEVIRRTARYAGVNVRLYVTGLTIAAIAAVKGLEAAGCTVLVMNYDRESDSYIEISL